MRSNPLAGRGDGVGFYGGQAASAAPLAGAQIRTMRPAAFNVTQVTFLALNPSYPPTIQRCAGVFAGVNHKDTTMTSFQKLFGKAIAMSAALSMTAGLA